MDNDNWLLKVEGLTKVYGEPNVNSLNRTGPLFNSNQCPNTGAIVACNDINFTLYPGEVLGIVGESGSGKSTVVKMLYFDFEPTKGSAYLRVFKAGKS
ncbi:MAG: ATP-binding cassette domain-containing protein, partial [Bacteroidota bacterium]